MVKRQRTGKGVTEAELRTLRENAWAAFMDDARRAAAARGKRVRVVGVRPLPHRMVWTYVIKLDS